MSITGDAIARSVLQAMNGNLVVWDEEPKYCLRVTKEIVASALNMSWQGFYDHYRTNYAANNPDPALYVWARDMMVSFREQGLRVAESEDGGIVYADLRPGDLIASWKLGGDPGHIAVLLTGGLNALAFENTGSSRGVHISGYNRLSRVDELTLNYPLSWEAYRLPEPEELLS